MAGKKQGGGAKERAPRGRNYGPIEDKSIMYAWTAVTGEGNNRTAENFWTAVKRVSDAEVKKEISEKGFVDRRWGSIQNRFSYISQCVGRFLKCLREAETIQASVESPVDAYNKALQIYKETSKGGKAFDQAGAYTILTKSPKFMRRFEDEDDSTPTPLGSKRSGPDDGNAAGGADAKCTDGKMPGVKKMKLMKDEQRRADERLELSRQIAKAAKEKNVWLQAIVMHNVFNARPRDPRHAQAIESTRALAEKTLEEKLHGGNCESSSDGVVSEEGAAHAAQDARIASPDLDEAAFTETDRASSPEVECAAPLSNTTERFSISSLCDTGGDASDCQYQDTNGALDSDEFTAYAQRDEEVV